jgi:hypothetical protein
MALEPCKECGQSIASTASACPHCGAPTTAPPTAESQASNARAKRLVVAGMLAFWLGVVLIYGTASAGSWGILLCAIGAGLILVGWGNAFVRNG